MKKEKKEETGLEAAFEGFLKDTFFAVFQSEPEKGQSRKDFVRGRLLAAAIIITLIGLSLLFEYG